MKIPLDIKMKVYKILLKEAEKEQDKVVDIYKFIKDFRERNGKPFTFNFSIAGYGKTTYIIRNFNFNESIALSFLNTTIDVIMERLRKEGKEYKFKKEFPAKTFHSFAYRILESEGLIKNKEILDFGIRVKEKIKDLKKENKDLGEFYYNVVPKIFSRISTYGNPLSVLEYPLLTLSFKAGYIQLLLDNINSVVSYIVKYLKEEKGIVDSLLVTFYLKKLIDFYDILEELYFDNDKYISFTSLLGLLYKYNILLFDRKYFKVAFSKTKVKNIIIDEAQDLNPLMVYLLLKSYENNKVPIYFFGDPFQTINSFNGSNIFFFFALALNLGKEITFKNETRRINKFLVNLLNKEKILPKIKKELKRHFSQIDKIIPFDEFVSLVDEGTNNKIYNEIKEVLKGDIEVNIYRKALEEGKTLAILFRTNREVLKALEFFANRGLFFETTQRDVLNKKEILVNLLKRYVKRPDKMTYYKLLYTSLIFPSLLGVLSKVKIPVEELDLEGTAYYSNIVISTINSFKGREADYVILYNKNKKHKDIEDLLLYYTSLTRAKILYYDDPYYDGNNFNPLVVPKKDPASFSLEILKTRERLKEFLNKNIKVDTKRKIIKENIQEPRSLDFTF